MSPSLFSNPRAAQEIWLGWVKQSGLPMDGEDYRVSTVFLPEIAAYCELVSGPRCLPVGFMTRGEDETFTTRAAALMHDWELPAGSVTQYRELAEFFGHKRAFLKLEWTKRVEGGLDRLAAYYYRRRPAVEVIRRRYAAAGVAREPLECIGRLAALLNKRSIHFVSAALRPRHPIHHKLYFSQYATPESSRVLVNRLAVAMRLSGIDPGIAEKTLEHHMQLVPYSRTCTIFVSMRFTDRELLPVLKIDYPDVRFEQLAMLSQAGENPDLIETARSLCAVTGAGLLTYVGVTLSGQDPPKLKLYVRLPPSTVPLFY